MFMPARFCLLARSSIFPMYNTHDQNVIRDAFILFQFVNIHSQRFLNYSSPQCDDFVTLQFSLECFRSKMRARRRIRSQLVLGYASGRVLFVNKHVSFSKQSPRTPVLSRVCVVVVFKCHS